MNVLGYFVDQSIYCIYFVVHFHDFDDAFYFVYL